MSDGEKHFYLNSLERWGADGLNSWDIEKIRELFWDIAQKLLDYYS